MTGVTQQLVALTSSWPGRLCGWPGCWRGRRVPPSTL